MLLWALTFLLSNRACKSIGCDFGYDYDSDYDNDYEDFGGDSFEQNNDTAAHAR